MAKGSNAMDDYLKRGKGLLRRPVTQLILGGVAITVIAPYIMRMFRNPEIQTFVRDNVDGLRTRVDGLMHSSFSSSLADADSMNG